MNSHLLVVFLSLAVVTTAFELRHVVKRQVSRDLNQYVIDNCASNPSGNDSQAFHIAHPLYCNAFFTCIPPTSRYQCIFCGEGLHFPGGDVNYCVPSLGRDLSVACNNRDVVIHADKVTMQQNAQCSPFIRAPVRPRSNPNQG